MLSVEEIKSLMDADAKTEKKKWAKIGQRYYDGDHDIRKYRIFYYNADGELKEDTMRTNVKIPHPFFAELTDQATQYILSGNEGIIKSNLPELQSELDGYFNKNNDFLSELSEVITGCATKGFEYMYAYKNEKGKTSFQCADSIGIIEVRAEETDDNAEYIIYWYIDRIDKDHEAIKRIEVWDKEKTYYYVQKGTGEIKADDSKKINPRPHILFQDEGDEAIYFEEYGFIPFFRLDNNKKQVSALKTVKDLIDDYDMMASGLSNNLIDFDMPVYVVKGFEGDNLDELQQNIKTKKIIGMEATDQGAGLEVRTIEIPHEARKEKLELDEKNIYRFGMGLNTSGLKDTNATTNIAIKAAYSLLDLKASKLETNIKKLLRSLCEVVIQEINELNGTDYRIEDVYYEFLHEVMSNSQENAQIELTKAQAQQTKITTLLNLAARLDNDTLMKAVCDELDIDYEDIKDKLPDPQEAEGILQNAQRALNDASLEGGLLDE